MFKKFIIFLCIIAMITTTSAVIFDKSYSSSESNQGYYYAESSPGVYSVSPNDNNIWCNCTSWSEFSGLYYLSMETTCPYFNTTRDNIFDDNFNLTYDGEVYATGRFSLNTYRNIITLTPERTEIWFFFDTFDTEKLIDDGISTDIFFDIDFTGDHVFYFDKHATSSTTKTISEKYSMKYAVGGASYYELSTGTTEHYSALHSRWKTDIYSDYDYNQANQLTINSYEYETNVSILDIDGDVIHSTEDIGERVLYYSELPVTIRTISPYGFIYYDELGFDYDYDLSLSLSQNPVGLYQDYECYLTGLSATNTIKRVSYNIYKIGNDGEIDTTYFTDSFNYFRGDISDNTWSLYSVIHGNLTTSDGYSEYDTKKFLHNITDTGTYKIICDIYDFDDNNVGSVTSEILTVGSGVSSYISYDYSVKDATTGQYIAGVDVERYLKNEVTGNFEYLDNTIISGKTNFNVLAGRYYMYNLSAPNYEDISEKFIFNSGNPSSTTYMFPSTTTGKSNLVVNTYWADAETYSERVIEYVKVELNDEIIYSNEQGKASFSGLTTGNTYNYTASKNSYDSISGSITIDESNEVLTLYLSLSPVVTTPTLNISQPTNIKESISYALGSIFGVETTENMNYIFALLIIILPAIIMGMYVKSAESVAIGAVVGFVITIAIGLIPIWVFFAGLAGVICYLILKSGNGGV